MGPLALQLQRRWGGSEEGGEGQQGKVTCEMQGEPSEGLRSADGSETGGDIRLALEAPWWTEEGGQMNTDPRQVQHMKQLTHRQVLVDDSSTEWAILHGSVSQTQVNLQEQWNPLHQCYSQVFSVRSPHLVHSAAIHLHAAAGVAVRQQVASPLPPRAAPVASPASAW